jgi:Tfp pilus assembly protein PilF
MDLAVPRSLIIACLLHLSGLALAEPVAWPAPNLELIHSARLWEARDRADLAQLAMKKLVAARPDSPEAMVGLGEIDLRISDFSAAAEVEAELNRRFKQAPAAVDFSIEYRIATRDRLQLASIRRLVELDRGNEVRTALEKLFPGGAPRNALGIDYYLLLGSAPDALKLAYEGMRRLAADHPDDPRYQIALARLMLKQSETQLAGVRLLEVLRQRDDVRADDVDKLLATGLRRLGAEHAPVALVLAYLRRHPDDTDVLSLRVAQERAQEEHRLLSPATMAAVMPQLQQRLSLELKSASASAARMQARLWLERSAHSLRASHEALAAAELRAALAFSREDYESQIAIAKALESLGAVEESGELLSLAARLSPSSSWLFETEIRWLIAHGRAAQAIERLEQRTTDRKWTEASRDKLLSAALDQRARQEVDAGRVDAAISDLEAAILLSPRDAWMRYRLAQQYSVKNEFDRGRAVMSEGVRLAPDGVEMRYAQALYLASLEDYEAAYAAIDGVAADARTPDMDELRDRARIAMARARARRLAAAGDLDGARRALLEAESIATHSIERAADLAYAWIELGLPEHGIAFVQPYLRGSHAMDTETELTWAKVLNSADDNDRLEAALARLKSDPRLSEAQRADLMRMQRDLDLRIVRTLERQGNFTEATRRLDALLAQDPQSRALRIARADLDLATGHARAARDRYASLVAEDPDDLDTRLSYVRALTETGDRTLARIQLRAVQVRLPSGDEELTVNLARRELALDEPAKSLRTLRALLEKSPQRVDVLMLAARAELAQRHFARARAYFDRAADAATGAEAQSARRASQEIQDRLEWVMAAGAILRHQPGDAGMSQIDALTIPTSWLLARGYESRVTVRADAVYLDAGQWRTNGNSAPLLGTLPTAGAGGVRYTSDQQAGLSPGLIYQTDSLAMDLGATPLGFLLPNVVGGVEWTPTWHSTDLTLGIARRAVTSSELSYAGLKDPITGISWGGVVQSGPHAGFGIYRDRYDISGSLQVSEITGTRVPDNRFAGARLSGSGTFLVLTDLRADAGLTLNYWNYQHNLSNYTFGAGGYYSPQSYVSLALPVSLDATHAGWSYRLRIAPSFSVSELHQSAFYPDDTALQSGAEHALLPSGYSTPYFSGYHSTGFGFSAYAAGERKVGNSWLLGFALDMDRTDFYHPTTAEIYLRHAFAPWSTHLASPPRPIRAYNP